MTISAYAKDGVNIEAGDKFSAFAGAICRESWKNNPRFVEVLDFSAHFRGPRGFRFRHLPKGWFQVGACDGVGTKVAVSTESNLHCVSGHDVLAMSSGDITRWGGMPLVFWNVLDVSSLGDAGSETRMRCQQLVNGLGRVAHKEKIVLMAGETAELGAYVGSENPNAVTKYNWAGFALGVNHKKKLIDGSRIHVNNVVVAIRELGFRSNGLSAVRKALALRFGAEWWNNPDAQPYIALAATPSMLFDHFMSVCNGWHDEGFEPRFDIHGLAHISGGGIPGKFFRDILAPLGLSANLPDLFDPPEIMQQCAAWRGKEVTAQELYEIWGGGQCLLAVMPQRVASQFVVAAENACLDAQICGTITSRAIPELRIRSKFVDKGGADLVYRA